MACFICSGPINLPLFLLAGLSGALVNAGGNIINDYFDIEIDKINRPDRPLPSGKMSLKDGLSLYLYTTLFAFVIVYKINILAFFIVVVTSLMMFLYSYKLKGIPLVGNIVVSFFTGLAFLFGSVVAGNIYCGIIPAVFAFLISLMREIVKDVEDIEGDKSVHISTYPIKYGIDKSVKLISALGLILIIATTIPFLLKIYNWYYFVFVSLFVNGIIVFIIRELNNNTSQSTLVKASRLLKFGMVFGVIAILIGTKL